MIVSTPETNDRHQFAVVWAAAGYTRTGDKKVSAGTQLSVRWETGSSYGGRRGDKDDETETDAVMIVAEDVAVGSIVWEGKTTGLPTPVTDVASLYEVVELTKIPDVKGRRIRRVCGLKKWSDALPELA